MGPVSGAAGPSFGAALRCVQVLAAYLLPLLSGPDKAAPPPEPVRVNTIGQIACSVFNRLFPTLA